MSLGSQLQSAFEMGERNQRTLALVKNWCAHARLERYGGGGLAEAMSGNPIGLMGMGCDHAPAGGFYGPDLAAAALDFHDRNCASCKYRVPVGLPNLTALLNDRAAAQQDAAQREAIADAAARAAHAARQASRDKLRTGLGAVSATIVDQLSALDEAWDRQTAETLVATAKLAPEAFTPPIIDYLFSLVEGAELWAPDVVLGVLLELSADPARLARVSSRVLAKGSGETAARAMMATLDHVGPHAVEAVLPALIELAEPLDLPFPIDEERRLPEALLALHQKHPAMVEDRLASWLVQPGIDAISLGARGAEAIAANDPAAGRRMARRAISAMVRGKAFEEAHGVGGQAALALRNTIARAYEADPEGVEALMQSYLVGGPPTGQGRLFTVYREILDRSFDAVPVEPTRAHEVAFRRLLHAATESHPEEIDREIQSLFRVSPRDLVRLATQNIDALLGAALVLDDRVKRLEAESEAPGPLLSRLERNQRRDGARQLQQNLVSWAAHGAADDLQAIRQFLLLLDGLPEDRVRLRAVMIGRFKTLATSPETFAEVLPPLYGAMVGASTLVRGAAAKVVGELPRRLLDDAPGLLLEAFVALLNDPYQWVLSRTVDALARITLPKPYHARARARLAQVVPAYATTRDQTDFLVDSIQLLAHRYLTDEERAGGPGAWIIQTLVGHPPQAFAKELPSLGRDLRPVPAFGELVLAALQSDETMELHGDDMIRALRDLTPAAIAHVRDGLIAVGKAAPAVEVEFRLNPLLVEVFSAAGDWAAAEIVANAAVEKLGDTRRELTQKLAAKLVLAATAFERALAEGRSEEAERIGSDWRKLRADLKAALA